jgi:hypothetical protein
MSLNIKSEEAHRDRLRLDKAIGLADRLLAIGTDCAGRLQEPFGSSDHDGDHHTLAPIDLAAGRAGSRGSCSVRQSRFAQSAEKALEDVAAVGHVFTHPR